MLDKKIIRTCAEEILKAYKTRTLLRPFSGRYPEMTIEDAYAVQSEWVTLREKEGGRVVGHKIGLTSKAMQSVSNVNEPDYGVLLDDTIFEDGVDIPAGTYISPRVEVELAFVMNKRLKGPNCSLFDVLNATDFVTPSLELLDSRVARVDEQTGKPRTIVDNVCDNAGNAALVVGGRPFKPSETNMRWVGGICLRNGQVEETGLAAGVLGHPARAIAWLANKLAQHDVAIEPGQMLLSGSFIRIVPAAPGDTFVADFGEYGTVSCHFS